ncbi:uncharacterized protein BO95DRAFT_246067 [Aspergillus brunneoviolaceus CBS 621.78]|uniref:Uncharacterized protein n=1 Tax=Aspergillus brunneoviolaceus CBS 621.78 TaxID=1450534 RepID=A0ACD1GKP3_9EURO|nr:hypothetical protein BO95DRAFT_246067 [Aspergillus brunneoviolaceus CBS 621.78]RAH49836.1 hypothetical protein BO95DRAFT_246067 [Aspergillus brunneoviolaceus CBS 621.78]
MARSYANIPPYTPMKSLGHELGILFGFLVACFVVMAVYVHFWNAAERREAHRDKLRHQMLDTRRVDPRLHQRLHPDYRPMGTSTTITAGSTTVLGGGSSVAGGYGGGGGGGGGAGAGTSTPTTVTATASGSAIGIEKIIEKRAELAGLHHHQHQQIPSQAEEEIGVAVTTLSEGYDGKGEGKEKWPGRKVSSAFGLGLGLGMGKRHLSLRSHPVGGDSGDSGAGSEVKRAGSMGVGVGVGGSSPVAPSAVGGRTGSSSGQRGNEAGGGGGGVEMEVIGWKGGH